jgi:hypothetical protein
MTPHPPLKKGGRGDLNEKNIHGDLHILNLKNMTLKYSSYEVFQSS